MNTRSRSRSRFTRHDIPFIVLGIFLLVMFLASLTAHAAEASALDQVANEVAEKVAGDLRGNSFMGMLTDLSLAGVLWFYSRRFYEDKRATDTAMLQLARDNAALAERFANLAEQWIAFVKSLPPSYLENIPSSKHTSRVNRGQDLHNAG